MFNAVPKAILPAVALFATLSSAEADMRVTGTWGAWRASEGLAEGGDRMCSAEILGADRAFFVKVQSEGLFLHIFKEGWRIPKGQSINVALQVDNAPPISLVGAGLPVDKGFGGFEVAVSPTAVSPINPGRTIATELYDLLASGLTLRLSFPDGSEQPWEGSLTGSAKALTAMMLCAGRLAAATTQPFGASSPTSTQSLGPAPSQPFGATPPALPAGLGAVGSEPALKTGLPPPPATLPPTTPSPATPSPATPSPAR